MLYPNAEALIRVAAYLSDRNTVLQELFPRLVKIVRHLLLSPERISRTHHGVEAHSLSMVQKLRGAGEGRRQLVFGKRHFPEAWCRSRIEKAAATTG